MGDSRQALQNIRGKFLRGFNRAATRLGLPRARLTADELIRLARRRSGLDDFGEWAFEEPLTVLLEAYEKEARLSAFGRVGARWDMLRFLLNLLRLREEEKREPQILGETISQPIFILGLPRSGTTFLHNLLAQDSANRVPRCWQTVYPYPEAGLKGRKGDLRARDVARKFDSFLALAPEFRSLHPLDAYGAQECIEITGQVIRSLRFDTTHYVPSYAAWLEEAGHLEAYSFHKRFLQHLQHQAGPGRWVLKTPDHIFAIEALQAVYPDARFIFVHRDPMEVLPSVARLTEILRQPFTQYVDRLQIGRQVNDSWIRGSRRLIELSEELRDSPERMFHVRYDRLTRKPLNVVAEIYRHFRIPMSERGEDAIRREIAERPNGGYGRNSYRFEDYGIDTAAVSREYNEYVNYFRTKVGSVVRTPHWATEAHQLAAS